MYSNAVEEAANTCQYLAEVADQKMAIQGVKYLRKIMQHPEMKKWSAGEVSPGSDITDDADLLE
jgi:choline dehydrogenase